MRRNQIIRARAFGIFGFGCMVIFIYNQKQPITPKKNVYDISRKQLNCSTCFTNRTILLREITNIVSSRLNSPMFQSQNHTYVKDFNEHTQQPEFDLHIHNSSAWASIQYLVKLPGYRVYMYSAIGIRQLGQKLSDLDGTDESDFRYVVITGWQHKDLENSLSRCCFMLNNYTIQRTASQKLTKLFGNVLIAVVYSCPLTSRYNNIRGVSIVFNDASCPTDMTAYIEPIFPKRPARKDGLAICSKLAYGQQNVFALAEWFEMQRYLGVSKILVYIHVSSITTESIPVFEYYQSIGLVWLLPFDIPEKGIKPRSLNSKYMAVYVDKRVSVLDCQARVMDFKYFTVLDKDEILMPKQPGKHTLKSFLDSELDRNPQAAGIQFKTQLHLTSSWNESNTNQQQFFANYQKCSKPTKDRLKNVVMPSRSKPFRISTHGYETLDGYRRLSADPTKATVHHYRPPRTSYSGVIGPLLPDGECDQIYALAKQVQGNAERVLKRLNLIKE